MAFDAFIRRASEQGKAIFPKKYVVDGEHRDGKKSLAQLRAELGNFEYSCQLDNNPIDETTVEFKRGWFNKLLIDRQMGEELSKTAALMSIDPAFRLKETNDYTGIAITKTISSGFVCVLEARRCRLNSNDLIDEIFRLYEIYRPNKILVETVGAQLLLADALRTEMRKRNTFFMLEELKTSTQETKAIRIRAMIPHYANGRILHAQGLNDLESELLEFPRGSHDDIIDALAYQVPYWKAHGTKAPPKQDPYMSLNWWKKQKPESSNVLAKIFDDFRS